MTSLRRMKPDSGWIIHLLHEAENERMHLMLWLKCINPNLFNRLLVLFAQGVFFNAYFLLYIFSSKTAHRFCGYLEEEAITSYTHFLNDLDKGKVPNMKAPAMAVGKSIVPYALCITGQTHFDHLEYYNLEPEATVRDVVMAVRADEAVHRDANHFLSNRIAQGREDLTEDIRSRRK